jgi:hypothetical protein
MTTETDNEYETKARSIAAAIGLRVTATMHPEGGCPGWRKRCDHVHGDRYKVTLRKGRRSLRFDFWNSMHDAQRGIEPGYYDVLSCVSSDAHMPTDPDEVVDELGEMPPSQAIATAKFAERLQAFFTEGELEQLAEIR